MKLKIKISTERVIATIVLISCLDNTYVSRCIPRLNVILFCLRIGVILLLVMQHIRVKRYYSSMMKSIMLFIGWLLVVTLLRRGNVYNVIYGMSIPLIATYYLDGIKDSRRYKNILAIWRNILFILLVCDIVSMILYPHGLYATSEYVDNWFLGYKTMRLVYILPLCILQMIIENKKIYKTIIVCLLAVLDILFSKATAAFVALSLICFVIITLSISKKLKYGSRKIETKVRKLINAVCSHYKFILTLFVFTVIVVVNSEYFGGVQLIIKNVFGKDGTFESRLFLWNRCMELFSEAPMIGYGYKSSAEYQQLFNNAYYTSPHNVVLSLLLNGGIIGICLYAMIVVKLFKQANKSKSIIAIASCLGIVCGLIVGITSSTILYTWGNFILFMLPSFDDGQLVEKKQESIYGE